MVSLTIRVVHMDGVTGERTEVRQVEVGAGDGEGWSVRGMSNFPPCACPSPDCPEPRTPPRNPVSYWNREDDK